MVVEYRSMCFFCGGRVVAKENVETDRHSEKGGKR
jgi:hypothetical protein